MRMKNGSSTPAFSNRDMQQGFGGWLSRTGVQHPAIAVDFQNLTRCKPAFIDRACGYSHAKRFAFNHGAEIPARTQSPATAMKIARKTYQIFDGGRMAHGAEL